MSAARPPLLDESRRRFLGRLLTASAAPLLAACAPRLAPAGPPHAAAAPKAASPRPVDVAPRPAPPPACAGAASGLIAAAIPVGGAQLVDDAEGDPAAWVVRDARGLYAVAARCTHMRCVVRHEAGGFACRCHGSRFDADGTPVAGPAPAPLAHYAICVAPDGALRVDVDQEIAPSARVSR